MIKRCMFLYKDLPHFTASAIVWNELSRMVMSLASLATAVPSPIDNPTLATLSAGASLVPSPVTATTCPWFLRKRTNRSLSAGRARESIFRSPILSANSSSVRLWNSSPVIIEASVQLSTISPTCLPISKAVSALSPVTILTSIPAFKQVLMASGTSGLTGSAIANTPANAKWSYCFKLNPWKSVKSFPVNA